MHNQTIFLATEPQWLPKIHFNPSLAFIATTYHDAA
jgi:hypothetical protein